jgi:hypothetical protein
MSQYTEAQALAEAVLKQAGSGFQHYMPSTKQAILEVTQGVFDDLIYAALTEREAQAVQREREAAKGFLEVLDMYDDTNDLRPLWFIAEAKKKVGRNPDIVSEQDNLLIGAFLEVIKDFLKSETATYNDNRKG